jgi:transposase
MPLCPDRGSGAALSISARARGFGLDRKTIRRCIAGGPEAPVYGPRKALERLIDAFVGYPRERMTAAVASSEDAVAVAPSDEDVYRPNPRPIHSRRSVKKR